MGISFRWISLGIIEAWDINAHIHPQNYSLESYFQSGDLEYKFTATFTFPNFVKTQRNSTQLKATQKTSNQVRQLKFGTDTH